MTLDSKIKKIVISCFVMLAVIAAFLVYSLAGLNASPIVFSPPPAFIEEHSQRIKNRAPESDVSPSTADKAIFNEHSSENMTTNIEPVKTYVLELLQSDNASNQLLVLFTHPDMRVRVRIALAFADLNVRLTHDETSDFREKRIKFYEEIEPSLSEVQNALFEALIVSAKEQTNNYIPYTLAWMPGQGQETLEMFSWAAQHHPDVWIRDFSVYFVVQFGDDEKLASKLLNSRVHDPDFKVRQQVFEQRLRILKEAFFGESSV